MSKFEYVGPPLERGSLPAVFYLALSAKNSLHLHPFNQPVIVLFSHPLRIFSLTLPGYHRSPTGALNDWALEVGKRRDVISEFSNQVIGRIEELISQNIIKRGEIGVTGLFRGGFIACHIAAKTPLISTILGFAPLTRLDFAKEFEEVDVAAFNVSHLVHQLSDRTFCFYIGNRDQRLGTAHCFYLTSSLTDSAYHRKIRSPSIELIISASIGHQSHGTSPQIFKHGADWMANQLGFSNAT